eukprot:XP_019926115.1 PREDICTED: uncharacterized protein LOC105336134 isoform X1 [Crassostrea gigas]
MVGEEKDETLRHFQRIADSLTMDQFEENVTAFKNATIFQENEHLQNYFNNVWLSVAKKWVRAFRPLNENTVVTTTNGVEVHHRILKNLLDAHSCRSIESLVEVIIKRYFEEMLTKYVSKNVQPLKSSKAYNGSIPVFLIEKTAPFMQHCLSRLTDATIIDSSMVEKITETKYKVSSLSTLQDCYAVDLSKPDCECVDFQFHFLPCKHILAILTLEKPALEICTKYLASKFFNSDRNFLEWMNEETSETHDTYDKPHSSPTAATSSNGSVEEFLTATSGSKPVNVFTANAALNRLRNFINNSNNEQAISDCIGHINDILRKLKTEYGIPSSFSKRKRGTQRCPKQKVPFSFLKRTLKTRRRIRKKSRVGDIKVKDQKKSKKSNATGNVTETILDHDNFQIIVDEDSSYPDHGDEKRDMTKYDTQSKTSIVNEDLKQLNDASQSQEIVDESECGQPVDDATQDDKDTSSCSSFTEEELNMFFEKVPYNPYFKIPVPDYAEVNPYNPNLMRIKPRECRLNDDDIPDSIKNYKPKRKIRVSSLQHSKSCEQTKISDAKVENSKDKPKSELPTDDYTSSRKSTKNTEQKTGDEDKPCPEIRKRKYIVEHKNPIIPDIEEIWKNHRRSTSLMAIVGQYKLYGYSFDSLRSGMEVTDEIIDAYMQSLVDASNNCVSFISCVVAGRLFLQPNDCALMSKLSLNCYDKIICPYNCSGHWELVVIFPHQKTIMYLDPLGENDKKKKSILQSWKTFINRRFSAGLESSGPSKWKIETAPHCKQLDSVSCGVYVMKFAELLLQRKPLFFNSRQMGTIRLEIAAIILGNCGNVSNLCRSCGQSYKLFHRWIQCNSCQWWHHFECADLPTTFDNAKRNSFYFLCKTCRGVESQHHAFGFVETSLPDIKRRKPELPEGTTSPLSDLHATREPFVLCKLSNRVKICAGCRNKFEKPLKCPRDVAIRHRELEKFFDKKNRQLREVFNNKYYHVSANCIQSKNPLFCKSSICIPPQLHLTNEYLEYFRNHGVDLSSVLVRKI